MFRITTVTDRSATIRLEGNLSKERVCSVEAEYRHVLGRGFKIMLDLRSVSVVDIAGGRLIKQLAARGVLIGPCSPAVAELLHSAGVRPLDASPRPAGAPGPSPTPLGI
jgi:anti-anti-sigma regulatory factor